MKTARCQRCKRMYEYKGLPKQFCPECLLIEEEEYQVVREYVKMHRGVTVTELASVLDISKAKIVRYLKEERLEVMPSSKSCLRCQACGETINTGMYCDNCRKTHDKNGKLLMAKAGDTNAKMHLTRE